MTGGARMEGEGFPGTDTHPCLELNGPWREPNQKVKNGS